MSEEINLENQLSQKDANQVEKDATQSWNKIEKKLSDKPNNKDAEKTEEINNEIAQEVIN